MFVLYKGTSMHISLFCRLGYAKAYECDMFILYKGMSKHYIGYFSVRKTDKINTINIFFLNIMNNNSINMQ